MTNENTQPVETQQDEAEPTEQEQQPGEETQTEGAEEKPTEEEKPEEGEGEEASPDAAAKAAEEQKAQHKRAGGWQRKIERLERERAILTEQLAAVQRGPPPAQPNGNGKDPTPQDKAAEYINGLVAAKLEEERARQEQVRAQQDFQRRTAEVRAAHADFDDVLLAASDEPVSPALQQALLTSEHGPAIMYELAKSPAELARISALPPLAAAREVGRLEARLASSTATPQKPRSAAVRPPAPPTSVNGKSASTRSLEDLPLSEYKRAYRSGRR